MAFYHFLFSFVRKQRICKAGCGRETIAGKCDTPGFPLLKQPEISLDHRGALKLHLPRNNTRLNQTSTIMLQSWRANCDVQVLIYNCDPKHPDVTEISKVTDYVVGYATKGNSTLQEEKEHMSKMIQAAEEITNDKEDIKRLTKQLMNKVSTKRLISRQESMVLLGQLRLTSCTEVIETVSLNNSKSLRVDGEPNKKSQNFVSRYASRSSEFEHMSLYEFYLFTKNTESLIKRRNGMKAIPCFVGVNGTPVFPVTDAYARHTIIAYKPWRKYPTGLDWLNEFNNFINSHLCPASCRLGYTRVMTRYINKMTGYEPVTKGWDHSHNHISPEAKALLELVGLHDSDDVTGDADLISSLDRGISHKWDSAPKVNFIVPLIYISK